MSGITSTGISIDSFNDLFDAIATEYKNIYGQDINIEQNTPDGQKISIFVKAYRDLQERGVTLQVEDQALEALVRVGFEPEYGARPMRRAIQDNVENKIAEIILSGKLQRGQTLILNGDLNFQIDK